MLDQLLVEALSRPKADIGNRKKIVGSSDLVCALKAYHSKIKPKPRPLKNLFVLSRGDGREHVIREAMIWLHQQGKLGRNTELICQLELRHQEYPELMSHLDIALMNQRVVSIVEVKSTTNLPVSLYPGWFYQGTFQVGLARMAYPEKITRCTILAVDEMTGEHRTYACGIDWQFDESVFNTLVEKAKMILAAVRANNPIGLQPEPSLLCSKCEYAAECPAIWPELGQCMDLSSHEELIAEYVVIGDAFNKAKKRREVIKSEIDAFMREASGPTSSTLTLGQSHVFDVKIDGRKQTRVSSDKLRAKYPEAYADKEIWDESSYSVLSMKARKDLKEQAEAPAKRSRRKKTHQQPAEQKAA
jgi:hypothetical protein